MPSKAVLFCTVPVGGIILQQNVVKAALGLPQICWSMASFAGVHICNRDSRVRWRCDTSGPRCGLRSYTGGKILQVRPWLPTYPDTHHHLARQLALHFQMPCLDHGIARRRREELNETAEQRILASGGEAGRFRGRGETVLIGGCITQRECHALAGMRGALVGIKAALPIELLVPARRVGGGLSGRVDHAEGVAEKDVVTAANDGFPVCRGGPRKVETRGDAVLICRSDVALGELGSSFEHDLALQARKRVRATEAEISGVACSHAIEAVDIVAEPNIEGKVLGDAEVVLHEEAPVAETFVRRPHYTGAGIAARRWLRLPA